MQIASRSRRLQETRLTKRSEELLISALTLGWESARPIIIDDADGKMERPDFLVSIAGQQIGAEVTTLRRPAATEGEAVVVQLNADVNRYLLDDLATLAFLADYTITCTLQRTPSGKHLNQLRTEIVDLVIDLMRSPCLRRGLTFVSAAFQVLHSFGALVHVRDRVPTPLPIGILVNCGPTFAKEPSTSGVALIDKKRAQAATYIGSMPLWLCVGLADPEAQFAFDVEEIARSMTLTAPFEQIHFIDLSRRLTMGDNL